MKQAITILAILTSSIAFSQKVTVDAKGNYVESKIVAVNTGKTFTDSKGNIYPVYSSVKGKLYVVKVSKKTGANYKCYLRMEGEVAWRDSILNEDNGEYVQEVADNLGIKYEQVTQKQFNDRYSSTFVKNK